MIDMTETEALLYLSLMGNLITFLWFIYMAFKPKKTNKGDQ